VILEDLKVANMSKSAKGTVENPGKNIKQKSGLNRAILDQGWSEFIRQLEYKLAWNGGQIIQVDPKNTSRKCPECGYISVENRKTQANFCCQNCNYTANADLVGSVNIREAGLALLGLGGNSLESLMKSQPVERA
jgi:putative transposase